MTELKRVKIRRERASFPAAVVAFLVFSCVFYALAAGGGKEKAVSERTQSIPSATRIIELSGIKRYLIALYAGESADEARLASARHMAGGAAGYLFQTDGKWHSFGKMYDSSFEADQMAEHIKKGGLNADVVALSSQGVSLRVTAPEETLDALSFCVSAFSEFEENLDNYASRLDAGKLSEKEARVLLSVLCYDLSEKKVQAEKALSVSGDNAASEIFIMYLDLLETTSALTKNEGGEMMLSARIKYAAIDNAIRRINLMKKLLS